jgi:hypothetical protein
MIKSANKKAVRDMFVALEKNASWFRDAWNAGGRALSNIGSSVGNAWDAASNYAQGGLNRVSQAYHTLTGDDATAAQKAENVKRHDTAFNQAKQDAQANIGAAGKEVLNGAGAVARGAGAAVDMASNYAQGGLNRVSQAYHTLTGDDATAAQKAENVKRHDAAYNQAKHDLVGDGPGKVIDAVKGKLGNAYDAASNYAQGGLNRVSQAYHTLTGDDATAAQKAENVKRHDAAYGQAVNSLLGRGNAASPAAAPAASPAAAPTPAAAPAAQSPAATPAPATAPVSPTPAAAPAAQAPAATPEPAPATAPVSPTPAQQPAAYDPSKITAADMQKYKRYTGAGNMNSDMDKWKTWQAMQGNRNASNADYRTARANGFK